MEHNYKNRCITPDMPYCPLCKYSRIEYSEDNIEYSMMTGQMPTDCKWICNAPYKRHIKDSTELSGGHLW